MNRKEREAKEMVVAIYSGKDPINTAFEQELRINLAGRKMPVVTVVKVSNDEQMNEVLANQPSVVVIRLGKSGRRLGFVPKARLRHIPTIVMSRHNLTHKPYAQSCGAMFEYIHPKQDAVFAAARVASIVANDLQTIIDSSLLRR